MNQATAAPLVHDDEVQDFVCHLYPAGTRVSYCGIPVSADEHALMHQDYDQKSPKFSDETGGPGKSCPVCRAPICQACLTAWGAASNGASNGE